MTAKGQPRQLEYRKLDSFKADERNPKEHDLDAIAASIDRFGYIEPVVIDQRTGKLSSGHGRIQKLRELRKTNGNPPEGITVDDNGDWLVPTTKWTSKSDAEAAAYIVAANRTTELGGWNNQALVSLLNEVQESDLGLQGVGFGEKELVQFIAGLHGRDSSAGEVDPDFIPEQPTEETDPISKLGDIWILGRHRVICGDATDADTVDRLMEDEQASMIFTDPPYGVNYLRHDFGEIEHDDDKRDNLSRLIAGALRQQIRHSIERAAFYIWHPTSRRDDFTWALKEAGLDEILVIIWAKPGFRMGWGHYHPAYEPCIYACRTGTRPDFYGTRNEETIWRVATEGDASRAVAISTGVIVSDGDGREILVSKKVPKNGRRHVRVRPGEPVYLFDGDDSIQDLWEISRGGNYEHATQKPTELARRAIVNSSQTGEIVLDSFGGSGSTLIACEQTGRQGRLVELVPKFVDLICRRYQTFTGELPIRAETGEPVTFL